MDEVAGTVAPVSNENGRLKEKSHFKYKMVYHNNLWFEIIRTFSTFYELKFVFIFVIISL
jgi:hypothetical protein